MATEDGVDMLRIYWDHFFKAETGTYEKSTWLDLFLAEFLICVNNGANAKELINFCPVSGVVTLVGCELLCGIHRVTSSINTHYSAPLPALDVPRSGRTADIGDNAAAESVQKPEEPRIQSASLFARANAQSSEEILRKYLLGGVAWRCLVLLRALGVEGLSCCRQLSSVLIWLYGELSAAPAAPAPAPARAPAPSARTPIHLLFSHRIWAKQGATSQGTKTNSTASEKGSTNRRSRYLSQHGSPEGKSKHKTAPHSDQSSESVDSNDDLEILNRSLAIKVCSPNDDFEYFNSSMRSSNEYPDSYSGSYNSPRKQKPKADDYMNDKHKEIINSEIGAFEFTLIITDLLQELCKAESSLSGSEGSQISMQCINFTLRNLCSLQFGSSPSQSHAREVSTIKVALTELLIVSLDKVLIHSDLCAKLINSGILPMLLRVLEDVISKRKKDINRAKETDKTESDNLLKLVFGIAYSITAFFHCLLMQCRTVDKLREFTDQFKLYGECLKGGLLKDCMELMIRIPFIEEAEVVVLIKKLIESIGKLINGMKRVRSEVIHSAACSRSRHKVCRQRVAAGMHHHHDILGEASNGLPMSSACCISVLYGTLTSLLTDEQVSAECSLRNKILRTMLNCGVCCCFSPGVLMESIVRLTLAHNTVAPLCLQLLEHTVYGQLGASVLLPRATDQLPCSICEPCDDKKDVSRKFCQHPVGPVERKTVWSFLIHYNSLLQLDNHNNVLHATVSHLLRVTPKCRMEMKYELLFSVVYPTFIVAKHRYIMRSEESAYFLTVSCLNIFASLLNTVSFAEQFIQKGGLSYVLELVSLPEFSNQCCSILEIAIIVEIFKLLKENSDMTHYREMSSLSSVQMLFKSLSEMTDKCFKIFKLKLPPNKYEELVDVTDERVSLSLGPATDRLSRKTSLPQMIMYGFACAENTVEQSIEDHIEVMKNIWTFWKTCAGLCLYSPMFREYIVGESALLDSYALLKVVLYHLCHSECGLAETRILIKIMEALLTVQLAVADVTSGRSKQTSCALVREALVSPAAALESGGGLRALCEALIRVASAEPSARHAMPRLAHAKVPPLLCPSGGSSAECSSSEESVAGVYASEHSDPPARLDPGYEADVEIGKFDLLPPHKNRKPSSWLSSINALISSPHPPPGETLNIECSQYTKNGELAHPELCIIVLDILTQLIDKVLTSKQKEPPNSVGVNTALRAAAALARACCARVATAGAGAAGAGAGAGAAGEGRLLHRLLAAPAVGALLACSDPVLDELQRSVLELAGTLAAQSIEPAELALVLRLFTGPAPPLGALLAALQRLVPAAHHTPRCILAFPLRPHVSENVNSPPEDFVHLTMNGVSSQSHLAETSARKLHEAHVRAGICSVWSRGGVRCGVEGAGWAPWLAGFAAVLWLRADCRRRDLAPARAGTDADTDGDDKSTDKSHDTCARSELAHVLSIGHDSLMFEMWLDACAGELTFRLSRPEASCAHTVSEARVCAGAALRRWTCVALNVRERVHNRRMFIQAPNVLIEYIKRHKHIPAKSVLGRKVTLFLNGYEYETVSLPIQGILVRKVTPCHVVVGHSEPAGEASPGVQGYHLAAVAVYRAPLLDTYRCLHLTAHGSDSSCMVRCEAPNYPSVITPELLDSNIDWDQMYELSGRALRELHEALLLTFSASAPRIINLYHQLAPAPPVFAGRLPPSGGEGAGGGGGSIPEALFTSGGGGALPLHQRNLAAALALTHPTQHLLFLYATVVELQAPALAQAQALGVLLQTCAHDAQLYRAFHSAPTADMLLTVFGAARCDLHPHLLRVILETACSAPILRISGATVTVLCRSDAVVLEPALLVLLARAASKLDSTQDFEWEEDEGGRGRGSLWALTLRCLRVVVRAEHPRRGFNHYQLTRTDLMHHLLQACKERFLNSESGPMCASASESLVWVVRGLVGEPPLLHRLAALCDFLLLMHQASDTFVTHSRANFYFLLTSETQEMSEFIAKTRKKSTRKTKRRPEKPDPAAATEDLASENSLNLLDVTVQNREDSDKFESSMESTKQMKGIINMQIKEGRKYNVSSTSENSDTTADAAEGSESEGRAIDPDTDNKVKDTNGDVTAVPVKGAVGDINEYIVVDDDDVNHTTVEMYSSGIYHKEARVRAGAAPGWAGSEGLLLLLRDCVALLPDRDLHQAVMGAIQSEVIVVLANQRCSAVRAAVVRVLAALQRRATPDLTKKLHSLYYYIHLANQIALYEASWELATACAALITKCDVTLEDQLDDDIWVDVTEAALARSAPLLALLPRALHRPALALAVLRIITRIVDKASLKLLNEISVVEVIVRSVRAEGARGEVDGEAGREGRVMVALYDALTAVAVKALMTQHSMQTVVDIHHMLTYIERRASEEGGGAGEGVVTAAQDAQAVLFTAQLEHLEERLHTSYTEHTKTGNYFTNVLTTAVSLGGGGAGGARGEAGARLGGAAVRAVSFLLRLPPAAPLSPRRARLLRALLRLLATGMCGASERPKWWVGGGAEWAAPLQELVTWALAGGGEGAGAVALRALYPRVPPLHLDPPAMRKLSVYLLSILKCVHGGAERGAALLEYSITDWARGWAVALQAGLAARPEGDALLLEAAVCRAADEARWRADAARHAHHTHRVVFGKEALAARVSEAAMSITRAAVETQNAERKRFMEHLRRAGAAAAAAHAAWTALVDAHTHEQGVWHDPRSYPQSWQLDPTEGAGRVRVRLRRAHLRMHPRFLKPAHRHKAEAALRPPPLHSILEGAGVGAGAARGGVVARLQLHETVAHMARAVCVTVAHDAPGELLLTDRSIHFVPDECPSPGGPGRAAGGRRATGATQRWAGAAQSWPLERVVRVETRRWCLQEVAVELFLSSGHAHLVAFSTTADRTAFLKALQHCHLPNKQEPDSLSEAMSQWRNGTITNWEYLMRVNGLGGRSYNDLMQYPVLPFILADYTSRILDLDRPQSFRDLSRPVAVQNKAREQHYINTYNDLRLARREGSSPLVCAQAHHYAALYSNSGGVLHYLVRLPPFTQLFLDYQDNNFDMPDRTFHSLATTWRLITQDSHTDVKELIPELFYLPELFRNNEGLNFGTRQCGAPVDSVELPAWAADARLFVLAHRQALEARAVTEALPAWIDLVFGYKQTGQAAIDAINVFPACTYYGFDPCALEDAGDRAAAADMVRTYGQAPRRLLAAPHPHVARTLPLLLPDVEQMSVCSGVQGARWGRYCGSPALGAPVVVARRVCAGAAGVAAPPHARALVALAGNTLLLLLHGEQAGGGGGGGGGGAAPLGVVSWGHSDDIVRLKRRRDAAHDLLLHTPALDQITKVSAACLSSPSPHPVFIGHVSGRVQAVRVRVGGGGGGGAGAGAGAGAEALAPRVRTQLLLAHSHPITDICVCAPAALLCTASCDGRIVLWDLNSLTYIRTLPNRERLPVTLVTISATLADVASVHDTTAPAPAPAPAPGRAQEGAGVGVGGEGQQGDAADDYEKDAAHKYKSLIRVHTCNAVFVGSVKVCERVCSVCYSHAAEGVSVNSLAAGLDSGGVRLYSSWDLRPTLYVPPADRAPLVSLRYSSDCSLLLGCYRGGVVAAWEAASGARPPSVRILPAHALL